MYLIQSLEFNRVARHCRVEYNSMNYIYPNLIQHLHLTYRHKNEYLINTVL